MYWNIFVVAVTLFHLHGSEGGLSVSLRHLDVSDNELKDFSELLMSKDIPNESGQIRLDLQNKVYSNVASTQPLVLYTLTGGRREPQTYALLRRLFQAYETNPNNVAQAKNTFLDQILETDVMKETLAFLNNHGVRMDKNGLKSYLDTIWFTPYSRGRGIKSSGFQHVFMAEIKNDAVQGLHNWLYYLQEQNKGELQYTGWSKSLSFRGYPSSIVKIRFLWKGKEKVAGSLFVGTSPELEMALYSICFFYRQQGDCNVSLGSVSVNIKTHVFTWNGEQLIGSAYPTI